MRGLRFRFKASNETKAAFDEVQDDLRKTGGLQASWNKGLNANRRAVQQFGFQLGDFATQIAGGQSAMLAFTQQGGQMLQFFGPAGAVAAAFLAVFGSIAIAFQRSGQSLSQLTPILGVLQDEFRMLGAALVAVKEVMIDAANLILNNMDRLLIIATTFAAFFATKWVAGFVAAKIATFSLVGALTALRAAMIRTGFLAVIVLAGELVYQFTRLVEGVGGFGNALKLVLDLGVSVLRGIGKSAWGLGKIMGGVADWIASQFVAAFALIGKAWDKVANGMAAPWNMVADSAMGEKLGMGKLDPSNVGGMIQGVADGMNKRAVDNIKAGGALLKSAKDGVVEAWTALRDAAKKADDEGSKIDIRDWFTGGGKDGKGGGKGGGKGATDAMKELAEKSKQIFDDMANSIKGSFSTAFKSLLDKTKSIKDTLSDMLVSILDKIAQTMMDPIWARLAQGISGALMGTPQATGGFSGGWLSGIFSNLLSFDGGGKTPNWPRSGGLDGKGGRLAMVHGNETIIDHTKGQQQGGGAAPVAVEVHIHEADGTVRREDGQATSSGGRIDVMLRRQLADATRGGALDGAMRDRFGIRPVARGA